MFHKVMFGLFFDCRCFYPFIFIFSSHRIIPNCIMKAKSERRRPFIGDQIDECRDASGLFYILCFQKGYLVNWDIQVRPFVKMILINRRIPYNIYYVFCVSIW